MRSLCFIALMGLFAACEGSHDHPIDASAEYEAFGESITAMDAIPVQAVAAEGSDLVGQTVKVEGTISEVCQMAGCWLTLQAVDGPLVRIDVPRDEAGAYVYTFPKDATGRRAIVAGVLTMGTPHHAEGEEMNHDDAMEGGHHAEGGMDHGSMEGHDERETEVLNQSVYTLTATGALLERVRA